MLADPSSPHTIKWVTSLCKNGVNIFLFGLTRYDETEYNSLDNINIYTLKLSSDNFEKADGNFSKIKYLQALPKLKKIITEFKPNIIHAHYASSYGLLGALSGFHPYILSVYGADVYNFPKKNFLTSSIFKFNLKKADTILSTSKVMAAETKKYTSKSIEVTPFGIDTVKFKPADGKRFFEKDAIVIGTIKSLEEKYGIEYLIRAFKVITDKFPNLNLRLLIVGKGTLEQKLIELVRELSIENLTKFSGFVSPFEIPGYHNTIDIFVSLSIEDSESFGVAVLEASACGKPVIVSNVGGLPEVVINNQTGLVVNNKDVIGTAKAIEKLLLDEKLRNTLGDNGRNHVIKNYNWSDNVAKMLSVYKTTLENN